MITLYGGFSDSSHVNGETYFAAMLFPQLTATLATFHTRAGTEVRALIRMGNVRGPVR
ncbi:hypothetical protein [Streptomyces sp. NPDC059466]|uniref:hypothetical protein n=1 Tax=unclassified Streptomyces TaxID=2593676 RepID=UPI00369F0B4F